jgi:hypothetical protein
LALSAKVKRPEWRSKGVARGADEALAEAAIPQIGPDRKRPEEPDAAPPRREVGSDHFAIDLGNKAGDVLGSESGVHVIAVRPEIFRVWRAQKGPERRMEDPLARWPVGLGHRPDYNVHLALPHSGNPASRKASASIAKRSGLVKLRAK